MSENTPENTPQSTEATASAEPQQQEPAAAPASDTPTPPWGSDEEFKPDVAWSRIQQQSRDIDKLRAQLKDSEPKLAEYDRLVDASKTELERAQEDARNASERASGLLRRTATAEIKAALAGLPESVLSGLLEDINVDRFIKDDEIDTEAISGLSGKYAAFATPEKPGMKPNPAQGASASPAPSLQAQIAQAQEAGDFKTAIRLKSQAALNASDS